MIIEAGRKDAEVLSELSLLLWENADPEELRKEYDEALSDDGEAAGFAHCALRGEYTEGVINLPAGYLEAVFVKEKYRRKGFARALVAAAEEWARAKGCTEFASDCECGNEDSVAFHKAAGFGEVNRIVCFVKKL